jgi:peptide-methionine (R)-S-oxide reductase
MMSRLIALLVAGMTVGALAYAEEESKPAATERTAAASSETKVDKKKAAEAEASTLEKQIAEDPDKVDWSKVDWKKRLTRMQYYILREAGTERAFQNKFWNFFKPGQYRCAGCGLPLFESDAKFESDCGWPSFDKTIAKDAVTEHVDYKIGYPRTEIRCKRCRSHLGHVFNDGPTDTGLRYCLNSAAMKFVHEKQLAAEKEKAREKPKAASQKADAKERADAEASAEPKPTEK